VASGIHAKRRLSVALYSNINEVQEQPAGNCCSAAIPSFSNSSTGICAAVISACQTGFPPLQTANAGRCTEPSECLSPSFVHPVLLLNYVLFVLLPLLNFIPSVFLKFLT
jgi:hypothetical protein